MSNTATSVRSSPLIDQSPRKAPSSVPPIQHPGFAMHPGVPVMIPPTPPQQSTEFLGVSSEQDPVDQQTQKFATEKTWTSGSYLSNNSSQGSKKDHKSSGFGRLKLTPKGSPDPASGSIYSGGAGAYMARLELWRTAAASASPPLSGSPPIDRGERHFYPQYKNPFHEPWVSEPDFSHLRSTSLDDEVPAQKKVPPKLRIGPPERSYTAGDLRGAQSRSLSPPPTPPAKDDHWKNLIPRQTTPASVSHSPNNRDTIFPPSSAPLATSPYGLAIHRGRLEKPRPAPSPPTSGEKLPSADKDSKGTGKAKKKKSSTKKVSYEDIPTGTYNTDVKPSQARNDFMPSIIKRFGKEKSTPTPPLATGIGSPWPPPPRKAPVAPTRPTTDAPARPVADVPTCPSADAPPHPPTKASVFVELPGSTPEKAEAVGESAKPSTPETGNHREPVATKRKDGGNHSRPRGEKRKVMPRKRSNESLYKQMPLPALPPVKPPSPPMQSQMSSPGMVSAAPRLAVQIPSTHLLTDQEIIKQLATALSSQNSADADADAAEKVGTFFHDDSDTEPDSDTSTTSSAIAVRAPGVGETSRPVHSPAFSVRFVPRANHSLHNSLRLSPSTPRADWESRTSLASSIGDPFCYDNLDKSPSAALLGTIGEDESQTPRSERRPSESSQFSEVEIHFEGDHLSDFVASIQHRRAISYAPDDGGRGHSHTRSASTSLLQRGLEAILTQRPNYERAVEYAGERSSSIDESSIYEGAPSLLAKEIERLLLPSSEERRGSDCGGWTKSERQTRYLAGRNSEVDSEILFVLRSSEIIPPTPGLRLPAVGYQPKKPDPAVHESGSEPLEPTVYEPEPLPPVAYDPEELESAVDRPEALEPNVYEHKPLLPVAYEPEPEPEKLEAVAYEPEKLEAVVYDPLMGC